MCGISGLIELDPARRGDVLENTAAMAATLEHRGPDDSGLWTDPAFPVGLGFRRLAIIDVTSTGHQPMASTDERWVLVFNGEIYNYRELRAQLPGGYPWRGHSDTEVLLAALTTWGVPETLHRADGMFALALWDRHERRLTLARDRFGEKPLYYGWSGPTFLFGSELKALRAHSGFRPDVDRSALALFLRHDYVPAPHSIYQGIRKLPPGTWMHVEPTHPGTLQQPRPYWSASAAAAQARDKPFKGSRKDAADAVQRALTASVTRRMVSEVPLGALLSGGVDSSLVVALMQAQTSARVQTFTIGFTDERYDESSFARAVAEHLGTEHTELRVAPAAVLEVLPRLPDMYDEPFSDSSQVAVHLVARLARQSVTVALTGDGGDELFGGYTRHTALERVWAAVGRVPPSLRPTLGRALRRVPAHRWDKAGVALSRALPPSLRQSHLGDKVHKLAAVASSASPDQAYIELVSRWRNAEAVALGSARLETVLTRPPHDAPTDSLAHRLMLLDTLSYLPEDILPKIDRATMATSLEARVPMLAPDVFELAWQLPLEYKVHDGIGKTVLRDVLRRYVPDRLIERPKMGFALPIGEWLRGDLRPWAEDLLAADRLRSQGYLNVPCVRAVWQEHLRGDVDHKDLLWGPLMFQAWLERWAGS